MRTCSRLRPGGLDDPEAAAKLALRNLARRAEALRSEAQELQSHIERLITMTAPGLLERVGIGPDSAAAFLVAAGDNRDRIRTEAAFSMLCGSSPVEASSGKVVRHRLNRGGDRDANAALYRVVVCRMRYDERTKAYVERRTKEGRSRAQIIRCLKRYVAREVYQILRQVLAVDDPVAA